MSGSLVKQDIEWVDSDDALERACEQWHDVELLAIDTEFMRSDTYYPIPGLIQINDGRKNTLIDPTKISDYFPLVEVFDNESCVKLIHSCSEDLEVFHYALGCVPKNMIDTQVAAALVGFRFSLGFANLIGEAMGIDIPKGETRSNWLQRPLSHAQLQYAAVDVEYLYPLGELLLDKLRRLQRYEWAQQDSVRLTRNFFDLQDSDRSFLRVKTAWKLNARQLAILKALCRWREDVAQDKNIPRNRVIKEHAMMAIAQQSPAQISALKSYEGLTERMIRMYGAKFLEIVEAGHALAEADLPAPLPRPLSSSEKDSLAAMKAKAAAVAENLDVPVELLVKKKDYEYMIHSLRDRDVVSLAPGLEGWRTEAIGDALLRVLS